MAQIEVTINGRDYQIACGDDEEQHVRGLLSEISGHVDQLASDVGQVGQSKLMLFAALVLADQLDELKVYAEKVTQKLEAIDAAPAAPAGLTDSDIADMAALISRIDAVAEQVQVF